MILNISQFFLADFFFFLDFLDPMVGVAGDVVLPSLVSGTAVGVAGDMVLPSLTTALVSLVSGTAVGVELEGVSVIEMAVMEDTTLATVTAA